MKAVIFWQSFAIEKPIHMLDVYVSLSSNSITPTLRQSPGQVPDKVADVSRTQIMNVCDTNRAADFHDLCPRQSPRVAKSA